MADKNKNYTSFWFWMFALFVMAIPVVGFIMIIVWAFVGGNESRKNYFRACIAWFLILASVSIAVILMGHWPALQKHLPIQIQLKRPTGGSRSP